MLNEKDIVAMLKNGQSVDSILKDMEAAVKSAQATIDAEKDAETKRKMFQETKIKEAEKLTKQLMNYVTTYYPNLKDLNSETMIAEGAKMLVAELDNYSRLAGMLHKTIDGAEKINESKDTFLTADEVLDRFLNNQKW